MTNTAAGTKYSGDESLEFIRSLLRGAGQVMFQNSAWTGLLFLCGIFWGAYAQGTGIVAWGALLGVTVSTLAGRLLGLPAEDGRQGLWGFNGILVGCAFPTFMGNTVWMWLALTLCAALTTWVRTGFNNVMAPWKTNSLTFPFVFCTSDVRFWPPEPCTACRPHICPNRGFRALSPRRPIPTSACWPKGGSKASRRSSSSTRG